MKRMKIMVAMSELINEAVATALAEDADDLAVFDERENEPLLSYEDMVKELKRDGKI